VISGPVELRAAALKSVLDWHYSSQMQSPAEQTVAVRFRLPAEQSVAVRFQLPEDVVLQSQPSPPPSDPDSSLGVIGEFEVTGLPVRELQRLRQMLFVNPGDELTKGRLREIQETVQKFDEHLQVRFRRLQRTGQDGKPLLQVRVSLDSRVKDLAHPPRPRRIRVSGPVSAARLIYSVPPFYPPEAQAAGIEGPVKLLATVSKLGTVQDLEVVEGPPELVPFAVEAVTKWRYRPTLLNGDPVEVLTQVELEFRKPEGK
jgi:TonB family protein